MLGGPRHDIEETAGLLPPQSGIRITDLFWVLRRSLGMLLGAGTPRCLPSERDPARAEWLTG